MQGQANHALRFAKERIPYLIQRYVGESERLYGILDNQLSTRDFLVGSGKGKYSIADIASFSWVYLSLFSGLDVADFPNVERWYKSILERPAVQKGLSVPQRSSIGNEGWTKRLQEDEKFREDEQELKELVRKAKEQYGYKYSSP